MAQQYSFPNVSFSETLVGPIPFTTTFRNRIGIAGVFRRGPRGATRVTNRQDAAYLYGDDNSPGAIAVRQAILQGATDLIISRATPQSTESSYKISLSSLLPTNEARVGYSGNIQQFNNGAQVQTTGLKLDIRYVGEAIESTRAAGTFSVSEASALSTSVDYTGLGLFEYVVEDYLQSSVQLTVAAPVSNVSKTISFDVASNTTYALNQTLTLTNVQGATPAVNEIYSVSSNNMQITITAVTPAVTATVSKNPGTLQAGTISAVQVKTLTVTSLATNLGAGSYLYFSNATFKLVDPALRSNTSVALSGLLTSATPTVTILQNTQPTVEPVITTNALITAPQTYVPETGGTTALEAQVQWVRADQTLAANQAFISNLKPGRLIYSNSATAFNPSTGKPLVVLSNASQDPTSPTMVRFLVKGNISGTLSNSSVTLYEVATNKYVFSSTFRVSSGSLPQYKKKANSTVTTGNTAHTNGATSIQLTSLPYRVDPGFIIDFGVNGYFVVGTQAAASASSVTVNGALSGNIPANSEGVLSDPMTYSYLQTEFQSDLRSAVVDSYVVSDEAVKQNNFDHQLLFERSDGVIFAIPSGIAVDLPGIESSNKIAFLLGGTFRVPVAYASVGIGSVAGQSNFSVGTGAGQILSQLKAAIETDVNMLGMLAEPELSVTLNPPSLTLKSNYTGSDANRLKAVLTREVSGTTGNVVAEDFLLNATNLPDSNTNWLSSSIKTFAGATVGSRPAFKDFYSIDSDALIRVLALSDGVYGNKLKVTLTPQANGQFTLFVVDEDSGDYLSTPTSETLTLSTRDVATNGLFNASANSRLIRAFYLPVVAGQMLTEAELDKIPMRQAPSYGDRIPVLNVASSSTASYSLPVYAQGAVGSPYLQNVYLEGGSDASISSLSSVERATILRQAVQALESEDVSLLYCAGFTAGDQNYSPVVEEMVGQVNRANVMTGLRTAVIQAPQNLSESQAQVLAASLDNPRVVLIGGHTTMQGVPGFNNTPAAGLYVGLLASKNPEISPAAAGEGMIPNGVISVDTPTTTTYLDAVTRARTEVLYYDAGLRTFKFLSGISTTSVYNDRYVSIRRMGDQILQDLYSNLIWVRSNRNTEGLRSRVASAVDAYLQNLQREERIIAYRPTLCNESNNPSNTIAQGVLNIAIFYTPVFPADYIRVNVTREIEDSLSIQTL